MSQSFIPCPFVTTLSVMFVLTAEDVRSFSALKSEYSLLIVICLDFYERIAHWILMKVLELSNHVIFVIEFHNFLFSFLEESLCRYFVIPS